MPQQLAAKGGRMNKVHIAVILALSAPTAAVAQEEQVRTFRLKNTTTATVSCRIVAGESRIDLALPSGKRWKAGIAASEAVASCSPPVRQLGYRMTGNTRYILLRAETGGEIEIVSVAP